MTIGGAGPCRLNQHHDELARNPSNSLDTGKTEKPGISDNCQSLIIYGCRQGHSLFMAGGVRKAAAQDIGLSE